MTALPIGSTIGILGGGQLGRMLALAGAQLGFDVHIFEPEADCPAGRVAARCVTAPWDDQAALADFAKQVDVITFEFENVPVESLAFLAARKPIRPQIKSLELTKDRLVEKQFVNGLGIPTAPFAQVDHADDLHAALKTLGHHGILKTRQFGYDGKGQIRIAPATNIAQVASQLDRQAWIYEGFVDFSCEVSVILARTQNGAIAAYDLTENVHEAGILRTATAPASVEPKVAQMAHTYAATIAHHLEHVGVLAVEFFVARDQTLIVNEIAPRVHNSGHWTQDGCHICQFQSHMRAVAGWPLGDIGRHAAKVMMTNLIGNDIDRIDPTGSDLAGFVHLYGKRAIRAGRKMGHVNQIIP